MAGATDDDEHLPESFVDISPEPSSRHPRVNVVEAFREPPGRRAVWRPHSRSCDRVASIEPIGQ
jgi:hypothetical protein